MNVSVIFSPQEVDALPRRDLSSTTCVVFDVLRATSTMLAAFANGADRIKPVTGIEEAFIVELNVLVATLYDDLIKLSTST